ncbi:hypothetical protein P4O66_009627 [Electrophorus voltai]|uniref:FYVE, RhoGEF and PH domain containing 5a n=1 Tax=Electrophorus voltai TaxID=2609070 RepID=A0AAD8ZCP4_9TELE|nr:hypothetical protein P4O66_009627 [Electrophorus voltai]
MPNIHRNKMLRRWKESRQKEALEQREESKTWKNIERKEGAMKGVELTQADKKEWDDVLGPGEELGCGEELAQSGELDWEVGLEQGKEFDSDEGEALADVDGLFECDLFEQSKPSGTLEIEEVGDHGDTVMLSVGEGSESSNGSLSSFIEEYGKESKQDNKELLENPSPLLGKSSPDMQTGISQDPSHTDDPLDLKSDREAGILSELSHQPGSSSSSLCSSEAMTTYDEMERNYAIPSQSALSKSTSSDFSMTSELELPFASSAVCFKPIHKKSQQTQVEQCDGQKEESSEVQDVYENVLNTNPHYENVQLRLLNPSSQNQRSQSSANDTDGYVDMSSLPGFQSKGQSSEQETESAYTICSPNVWCDGSVSVSVGMPCTKKEERKSSERLTVNYSRAFYTAKELLDSETQHVKTLKLLSENIDANEKLREFWGELPVIYSLHQDLISQLETRIKEWDQNDGIADIILAKKVDFSVFSSFISHHDNRMKALDEMDNTLDGNCLKQQLLQVIVRVLQYHVLLTDYLNNISPDSREYEDAQAALAVVSDVADQANNNLKNGADLLRLVRIEHSVLGLKNLLQPGRLFVKEGTLMKVSRKSKQPRHLFLMSDIMLYTYPQQDGKYRLINTLALTGMEVIDPQWVLSATVHRVTSIERDDWFVTLNRTIADLGSFLEVPSGGFKKPGVCLGENAPSMVSVSQVAVCMNCPVHFSLTHRRHHCHACGKVVCRDCCRNKVPLKYMKNKRAKVCDKCYSELSKHEGDVAMVTENLSRPLSAVFQNIHPPSLWRGRKGQVSFNQVTGSEGEMSGTLQRSRNSKRSWKSLWFLLKDKVLYTYPQPEERLACESLPLLGFSVRSESEGDSSMFQLYHKTTLYYTFKAQDMHTAQR